MKFRALVVMTVLSLFLLVFFLGLSLVKETAPPPENSLSYRLIKGAVAAVDYGKKALAALSLQLEEGIDLAARVLMGVRGDLPKAPPASKPVHQTPTPSRPGNKARTSSKPVNDAPSPGRHPSRTVNVQVYPSALSIPVLWYDRDYLRHPRQFAQQAGYLAANDFVSLTIPELAAIREGKKAPPGRAVALVFEGRVGEFYEKIYPVLQKHRLKATAIVGDPAFFDRWQAFSVTRYLRLGREGAKVRELQESLNSLGYPLAADGIFGPRTRRAVIRFQQDNSLLVDGIVGPQTAGQINRLLGEIKELRSSSPATLQADPVTTITKRRVPYQIGLEEFAQLLKTAQN